ncbi:MAG: hypothetical protein U5R49_23505 [Deltaproteobacteria bacterium]|nr:hypothetical protein [Deltaproteobacteria bacterium]
MATSRKRKLLYSVLILILISVIALIAAKRIKDKKTEASSLLATKTRPMPVRCVRARLGPIRAFVFAQGTARAVRRDFLTFEENGKVTYVKRRPDGQIIRAGDRVKGPRGNQGLGELLASLDKRDVIEQMKVMESNLVEARQQVKVAEAQLRQAKAQAELSQETFKRNDRLFKLNAISRHELDVSRTSLKTAKSAVESAEAGLAAALSGVKAAQARIQQTKLPLERSSIYASFDGILAYVNIKKGDYFAPNLVDTSSEEGALKTIPMVIIDPDRFEVTMELPPFEGALVKPGQPALVMTAPNQRPTVGDSDSGIRYREGVVPGKVFSVSPAITPGGRATQVKVRTDEGGPIRDGMFVTCWIVVQEKSQALVVPYDVFVYRENLPYIFVVDETRGTATQHKVVEGIAGLTLQEILGDILPGALLITDGRHHISSGAPVDVIEIEGVEAS